MRLKTRKRITKLYILLSLFIVLNRAAGNAQPLPSLHEGKHLSKRSLRYIPDGEDFVIVNGKNKFNRALYGSHSGFRLETGDVPEFALYLPRMGGNLSFALCNGKDTISLNNARYIESRYRPGTRLYTIKDPLLKEGAICIFTLALYDVDGAIWKITAENIPDNIRLLCRYGGASYTRFSREGDLGVDPPDCFDLKPEYCNGNRYVIDRNRFTLYFGQNGDQQLFGCFPSDAVLKTDELPALHASTLLTDSCYIYIGKSDTLLEKNLTEVFIQSEKTRQTLASRIIFSTPDPFFNTLGGALTIAADAVWDGQVWLHGAIGWRMPLTGWRGAYTGDFLGWHDRARSHFDAYAASQVTRVPQTIPHPAQDKQMNLARAEKKWGTPMYSNGYICRNPYRNDQMHHYNMNLCYIDELLWHFNWTGDWDYAKKMWPVIKRHLDWEKRNWDPDDDGLYDAYACIWASDALYYTAGSVTHSTAYNYRANKMAAEIAEKMGEDPAPYRKEAEKIYRALNQTLWMPDKGYWAEYKDRMGLGRLHESAALWTIYQAIDSEAGNPFQWYQATRYIDNYIPHIPVQAEGLTDDGYYTLSTTNWHPYSWSINNIAFAEVMSTALAYFRAGRNEEGCKLLKSSILDGMYLGESPGNFGQISFYDAARGECYRDFADPIGVASRVFVQGLFGINPDALHGKLFIRPGFPQAWDSARIKTPDIQFSYKNTASLKADSPTVMEVYSVHHRLANVDSVELQIPALTTQIKQIGINGKPVEWKTSEHAIGKPGITIRFALTRDVSATVKIEWIGEKIIPPVLQMEKTAGDTLSVCLPYAITDIYDPQQVMENATVADSRRITGRVISKKGAHTFFIRVNENEQQWWRPVDVHVAAPSNPTASTSHKAFSHVIAEKCTPVNIDPFFNSSVTDIFRNSYITPRPPYTSLQIPVQGIGEWCHPHMTAEIDDTGMREKIVNGILSTSLGVPFRSPEKGKNIVFTSLWDNYPDSVQIPLSGKASHAYLLMAGSTNHMQSRISNGIIRIYYTDGSFEELQLINPENWCPIEQDYYVDNLAFRIEKPRPYRLHFATGLVSNNLEKELHIEGVYGRSIEAGAGVLLDLPLNPAKSLRRLCLKTLSGDVVIGLMSLTLQH